MKLNKKPLGVTFCDHQGFTLLETMVALLVLIIGVTGIVKLQSASVKTSFLARNVSQSAFQGSDIFEKLLAEPYDQVTTAGNPYTVTNGKYTVQYTVSNDDVPIDNVKTITVTSWWVDGNNNPRGNRTYVFYKADQF